MSKQDVCEVHCRRTRQLVSLVHSEPTVVLRSSERLLSRSHNDNKRVTVSLSQGIGQNVAAEREVPASNLDAQTGYSVVIVNPAKQIPE
jgi:hypothetical protein